MIEHRCPNCEALIIELECFECAWHAMHENAVRLTADKLAALAPPTRTPCIKGHEMTPENTRLDVRKPESGKPTYRVCITCHRQRSIDQKARARAAAGKEPRPQRSETHCVNGHEMTPENTRNDSPARKAPRCKTCHRAKRVEQKARQRAEAIGGQA